MRNMKVCMIQLDLQGKISYINYGVKLIGYQNAEEVLGLNWFNLFLPSEISEKSKTQFQQLAEKKDIPHEYKSEIINRRGEKKTISY
jgi:two-component system sensor histidine kinase/response regulator